MRVYVKNNRTIFLPDPIWNHGASSFFERGRPNKKNKMSSDMRSVPRPETVTFLIKRMTVDTRIISRSRSQRSFLVEVVV